MRYENDVAEADIIADSKVQFATPQYRSETLMADAMLKYKQLGFPIQWVAEQMGQSSDEVQRIMRMRADEMADPELESLNRALQIGGADGGRISVLAYSQKRLATLELARTEPHAEHGTGSTPITSRRRGSR